MAKREKSNSAPTRASGGGPPLHMAPVYGTTERRYGGDKPHSSPIRATIGLITAAAPGERSHVAPEYGTTEPHYGGDKPGSSAIPATVARRGTVAAPGERYHVAWEDRSTGSYVRYNAGVQQDRGGEGFRRYENLKVRDAGSGFEGKYTAEEKYARVPHDHDDHGHDDYGHGYGDAVADHDDYSGDEW